MKKIELIIRHSKIDAVKEVLTELGVKGITMFDVKGFGRQGGIREVYRGKEIIVDFLPKVKLEIVTEEVNIEPIINAVCDVASTGEVGDGKIFVSPIEEVVRIRTKERGKDAL